MKKVKNLFVKFGKAYLNGWVEMYRPAIDNGINPFI